jgi:hypothetical protein
MFSKNKIPEKEKVKITGNENQKTEEQERRLYKPFLISNEKNVYLAT